MKQTKVELEKENTEFKKRHKTLLSKVKTQGDLIVKKHKENEALKSTIEGLNAIVKTQTLEFAQLKSAKDQLNLDMYPLHRKLNEAKGKLELAEKRIIELNKEINSSFFNRFLNWILS